MLSGYAMVACLLCCLLKQDLFAYLESVILTGSSPAEAFRRLDALSGRHVEGLRRLTKRIQDARLARDTARIKRALLEYDTALDRYMPVLMAQAKIYWDLRNYSMVERIFKQSAEFCADHDVWKKNVAHVFFMQEKKFKEAIRYYEPIVKKHADNILDVTAVILANLCVAYIMTSQNEEAEECMRQIEKEEERLAYQDPDKQLYHLCIVNLVIGTLYCSKGNFSFGIQRIMKSLEPFEKKLSADTWFYCKLCLLSHLETVAKQMLVLGDDIYREILDFLELCEENGESIPAEVAIQGEPATVAQEARALKRMYLRVRGD
eukprot:947601_1